MAFYVLIGCVRFAWYCGKNPHGGLTLHFHCFQRRKNAFLIQTGVVIVWDNVD